MKSKSYQRYYAKNRDAILETMRIRSAERRAERKTELENNPDALKEDRERTRTKYYVSLSNKIKADMTATLESPTTNDPLKRFIRDILSVEIFAHLTMKSWLNIKQMYANYPIKNTVVDKVEYGIQALRQHEDPPCPPDTISDSDSDSETEDERIQTEGLF